MIKKLLLIGLAVAGIHSTMSFSVSKIDAAYVAFIDDTSSGGTNGYITVRTGLYREYYNPVGGVHIYKCGARGVVKDSSSITTDFYMIGSFFINGSSTPTNFSDSGNVNSIEYSEYTDYDYGTVHVWTSSTAFGNTNRFLNSNFK